MKWKSYLHILDAVQGHILLKDLAGNASADSLAKTAAGQAAINEKIVASVKIGMANTIKIAMHLVTANLENLRQLEAKGFRNADQVKPAKTRRSSLQQLIGGTL